MHGQIFTDKDKVWKQKGKLKGSKLSMREIYQKPHQILQCTLHKRQSATNLRPQQRFTGVHKWHTLQNAFVCLQLFLMSLMYPSQKAVCHHPKASTKVYCCTEVTHFAECYYLAFNCFNGFQIFIEDCSSFYVFPKLFIKEYSILSNFGSFSKFSPM